MRSTTDASGSRLSGLSRRSLGPLEALAQSVGVAAPSLGTVSVPFLVVVHAGEVSLYAYLVATAIVWLVNYCITQFTCRMASPGSLHSFVAKGLGRTGAVLCSAALLLGYFTLLVATLLIASDYLLRVLGLDAATRATTALTVLLVAGAVTALLIRGVQVSSRTTLVAEAASIAVICAVFVTLLVRNGGHVDSWILFPHLSSWQGIGLGIALAVTPYIGFESAATVAMETRKPFRNVPRATLVTVLVVAALGTLSMYVTILAFDNDPGSMQASDNPVAHLARAAHAPGLAWFLDLGLAASSLACATASTTAMSRLLFALGREGVVPAALGRTSNRFRTPHVAIGGSMALATAVTLVIVSTGVDPWRAFLYLSALAALAYLPAYLLVCAALPAFLYRIGEPSRGPILAAAFSVLALGAVIVAQFAAPSAGSLVLPGIVGVVLVAVFSLHVLRTRRGALMTVGLHDVPLAEDLLPLDRMPL
jgi:amino acid transporter